MNIICLYWKGEFRGRDYTIEDIERLKQTVDKHIDRDYNFYILTNYKGELPGEKIMLKHNWPGWWSKVELHRPDLPCGRTLYLDLDSHIVAPLKPILDYPGGLVMFDSERKGQKTVSEGKTVIHHYQAATMLFTPGITREVFYRFAQAPETFMGRYRSDQDIMAEWIPHCNVFPDRWMTKLRKCRKKIPEGAIIVTGRPGDGSFRRMEEYKHVEEAAR